MTMQTQLYQRQLLRLPLQLMKLQSTLSMEFRNQLSDHMITSTLRLEELRRAWFFTGNKLSIDGKGYLE